jgi:hypothetical protein
MDKPPEYQKTPIEIRMTHQPPNPPKPAEVSEERIKEMRKDPLLNKLLGPSWEEIQANQKKSPASDGLNIAIGQVLLTVPKTWTAGLKHDDAAYFYEAFNVEGDSEATFSFYYRGRRTSGFSGEQFVKLLKEKPHDLNADELSSLSETLRRVNKDFTKTVARTIDLNGKRVLLLEGIYDKGKADEQYVKQIYIDSDGKGTAVQEVYFQAKTAHYQKHLKAAEAAFQNIQWK